MASEVGVILPSIKGRSGVLHPVPKRYEETKPAVVQNFTHRRILDLGLDFHQKLLSKCDTERESEVKAAEDAVWAKAEVLKQQAVETAIQTAKHEHDKVVKKLNKTHERTLKEELIRLSTEMERQQREAVEKTKQQGDIAKREAVQQTEELWQKKLLQAVDMARQEEREIAAQKADQVAKEHEQALVSLRQQLTQEKNDALSAMDTRKNKVRVIAVATAREEEQIKAENKLEHLKNLYEQQVAVLHSHIRDRQKDIASLQHEIHSLTKHRTDIQAELLQTRQEFQKFIDIVRPFNDSEAKYLMPPIHSFGTEAGSCGKQETSDEQKMEKDNERGQSNRDIISRDLHVGFKD